ncbi:unnamed protein product [Rangifer tarandus platyrhynchus]|uniref:Uncharacterized protein n=2 Tax=Rangifer tarandus platyrhynchus TaxID=3082113 RepID=A0AC59ZH82_RANTA|nr:unnamed protein product [Rangifer tarandus platyrhynchus]
MAKVSPLAQVSSPKAWVLCLSGAHPGPPETPGTSQPVHARSQPSSNLFPCLPSGRLLRCRRVCAILVGGPPSCQVRNRHTEAGGGFAVLHHPSWCRLSCLLAKLGRSEACISHLWPLLRTHLPTPHSHTPGAPSRPQ